MCVCVDPYCIFNYYLQLSVMVLLCCMLCVISLIFSHAKPPKWSFRISTLTRGEEKATFPWSVNSRHKSDVFCLINDPNGATGLSRMPFLSATHTLSKALSSLSSLIVIKVMRNVKGRNVGLLQQPQMLAKSSFTNIRFPWEKKRHRDRPGSGLTAHINVCVCFVYLLCNDRWCCDRGGRTKCAELPGYVRLFR